MALLFLPHAKSLTSHSLKEMQLHFKAGDNKQVPGESNRKMNTVKPSRKRSPKKRRLGDRLREVIAYKNRATKGSLTRRGPYSST